MTQTDQYANGESADPTNDPITTTVYTTPDNSSGVPLGLVYSTTDADNHVSASNFDSQGDTIATFAGQILATSGSGDNSATFAGLAPNAARTFAIYVPTGTSGYSVSYNSSTVIYGGSASLAATALGSGWTFLGNVTLTGGDPSLSLTVSHTGTSTVVNVCLMQAMSTYVYDSHGNETASLDPMGNLVATTFDNLDQPTTTSQGQVLGVLSGAATFRNVPQAPGLERVVAIFVNHNDSTYTNYTITEHTIADTTVTLSLAGDWSGSTPTALGSGWYRLGEVTIPSTDTGSTITVGYTGSGSLTQVAILMQTEANSHDPAGNQVSAVDGLNRAKVFVFNNVQEQTATWQGQIVSVASGAASFTNLPQTPGVARTFDAYVYTGTTTAPSGTPTIGGFTSGSYATGTPLGADWYNLGTISLGDTDASSELDFSGLSSSILQICIVQQVEGVTYTPTGLVATDTNADGGVSSSVHNAVGDEISASLPDPATGAEGGPTTNFVYDGLQRETAAIDPLGHVVAYGYQFGATDGSGASVAGTTVTTSLGQIEAATSSAATFSDLLQNPGQARVYTVYVKPSLWIDVGVISASDGYGGIAPAFTASFSASTPLGSGWYKLGTVTLDGGDASTALTLSCTCSGGASQIALVWQSSVRQPRSLRQHD